MMDLVFLVLWILIIIVQVRLNVSSVHLEHKSIQHQILVIFVKLVFTLKVVHHVNLAQLVRIQQHEARTCVYHVVLASSHPILQLFANDAQLILFRLTMDHVNHVLEAHLPIVLVLLTACIVLQVYKH
jgi:hypothetical protein